MTSYEKIPAAVIQTTAAGFKTGGIMETEGKNRNGKLSWGTRVAYAGGDVACKVIFGMVGTQLTIFYTD